MEDSPVEVRSALEADFAAYDTVDHFIEHILDLPPPPSLPVHADILPWKFAAAFFGGARLERLEAERREHLWVEEASASIDLFLSSQQSLLNLRVRSFFTLSAFDSWDVECQVLLSLSSQTLGTLHAMELNERRRIGEARKDSGTRNLGRSDHQRRTGSPKQAPRHLPSPAARTTAIFPSAGIDLVGRSRSASTNSATGDVEYGKPAAAADGSAVGQSNLSRLSESDVQAGTLTRSTSSVLQRIREREQAQRRRQRLLDARASTLYF
jgi:hypothetical protein